MNDSDKVSIDVSDPWARAAMSRAPLLAEAMTLRDYFAALALSSLVTVYNHGDYAKGVAKNAYEFADAMLEARAKQ